MSLPRDIIFEITFLETGQFSLIYGQEKKILEKFNRSHKGKRGFFKLSASEPNRSLQQNKMLHGPVIDGFVRLTGITNRAYWKSYLKHMFLVAYTEDGKVYIRSTADLTVPEFSHFIDQSLDHLADMGGYLLEYEKHEWDQIKHGHDQEKARSGS